MIPLKPPSLGRRIGDLASDGHFVRVVDRLVIHGGFLTFRELASEVLSQDTRYLIFDLDRTTHLGRNIGELFGFYLTAFQSYGMEYLSNAETSKTSDHFPFDWRAPLPALRQIVLGLWVWGPPGLTYFLGKKLGMRFSFTRKMLQRWIGADVISTIQQIPRTTLMHDLAGLPLETLKVLASQLWMRHTDAQVLDADDISWLREEYPNLKILISSASPQPVLEAAQEALGVDGILYTATEEHDGRLSAPHVPQPSWRWVRKLPWRISPPNEYHQNSSWAKLNSLRAQYPDFFDPGVESVGISDTEHGEDYPWMSCFTKVVDINSSAPFPPLLVPSSPLREVHSVEVLSVEERRHRKEKDPNFISPKRFDRAHREARTFLAPELKSLLKSSIEAAEELAREIHEKSQALEELSSQQRSTSEKLLEQIAEAVDRYNISPQEGRRAMLKEVGSALKSWRGVNRKRMVTQRPIEQRRVRLKNILKTSRRILDAAVLGGLIDEKTGEEGVTFKAASEPGVLNEAEGRA